MTENEVVAEYKHSPSRAAYWLMLGLSPLWALLAPLMAAALFFIMIILPQAQSGGPFGGFFQTIVVALLSVLCTAVGVLATLFFADSKIHLNRDGFRIPGAMHLLSRFPTETRWSDVRQVLVSSDHKTLCFLTAEGKKLNLKLSAIKKDDLERLTLSIDLWTAESSKSSSFNAYLAGMQHSDKSISTSFTRLWEEELEQRFCATSFVPLEPDAEVKSGEFRILRQLSFGGLSAIYLCQAAKKQLFVLKELVIPSDANEELREKGLTHFKREAETLVALDHPGIVKVFDHFVERGRHYLLLEYLPGINLRQVVQERGPQNEAEVLRWGAQIADLLHYFEQRNPPLIHRDLTPDNLVIDKDQRLVLIDFGAANDFVGKSTGTLVGKQAYMAPEQFRGKATPASDIYSLGGTLHFLLTGHDPEPLSTSSPSTIRESISQRANAIVQRCTHLEPDKRYSGAVELREALEDALKEFA